MFFGRDKSKLPTADEALAGRDETMAVPAAHVVNFHAIAPPWPEGYQQLVVGMGCFWGAERIFWQLQGVVSTAVGYQGGYSPNPTYEEVCSARTGHAEVVKVVYDPSRLSFEDLLKVFWESHDPTQGMRQGGDVGTQYRSTIYTTTDAQLASAKASGEAFQPSLAAAGYGEISTDIEPAGEFFYAEDYHQQYLAKNPNGYCGIGGTGVSCPIGTGGVVAQ
jgi:peptide-methionine (S)-S-oxide reductase